MRLLLPGTDAVKLITALLPSDIDWPATAPMAPLFDTLALDHLAYSIEPGALPLLLRFILTWFWLFARSVPVTVAQSGEQVAALQ